MVTQLSSDSLNQSVFTGQLNDLHAGGNGRIRLIMVMVKGFVVMRLKSV